MYLHPYANYRLLVQSKNTVKSVSSETNGNTIKMEDYVEYVNRQFDILLQHLATGWGQQIKAELATITNNNTLSELQKIRIYVLCKILCVETIFSIFKEICNCFVGLFSVVVNNQRNVCKSIFKIDCNIVSKRTVDQTPNAAPESMVIFIPEEKSFTSKICELIDKAKTVYNRGIAYFIQAGFSLGYENSEVYVNEFVSHCVETTTMYKSACCV